MKKKNLKSLSLNKKSISSLKSDAVVGAAPNTQTYCNCQGPAPEPLTIETYCWGTSGLYRCGAP